MVNNIIFDTASVAYFKSEHFPITEFRKTFYQLLLGSQPYTFRMFK